MGVRKDRVKRSWATIAIASLVGTAGWGWSDGSLARPRDRLAPTVILISLDGFRWDYLGRTPTPNLDRLIGRGVRARWMVPVYPTLTFPNHYSIVTGLYPAHHGIVGNHMLDPATGARFRYSDSAAAVDSRWWAGEPIWVTAERQGQHAGTYFWPGSEAVIGGVRPTYWKHFNNRVPAEQRVREVLGWLDLPARQRPTLLTLYLSDVDSVGHDNGPDSPQVLEAVRRVDWVVGLLVRGLEARRLLDQVNLVVVSDHGMASASADRVVLLDDALDTGSVDVVSSGAFVALRRRGITADSLLAALGAFSPHFSAYLGGQTPARLRYRDNPRIMDVIGMAEEGWWVTTRRWLDSNRTRFSEGSHGFDNALPSMRAIFIAAGPAFRRHQVVEPFQNIHLYELLCAVLGLAPAPNDGSLDSVRSMMRR